MKVLLSHPTAGGPMTAPGHLILVKLSDAEYVVWFSNTQDGGRYHGAYCGTYEDALRVWCERLARDARIAELYGWSNPVDGL